MSALCLFAEAHGMDAAGCSARDFATVLRSMMESQLSRVNGWMEPRG